ncbi:hypothetical protein AB1Y20_021962 [Prymnesium parvum]|uniref:Uncharacterized protein n=1 Tax=Prymnesium parvum TaxID=97485 RepID=A0AB34JHK2_PRYPA
MALAALLLSALALLEPASNAPKLTIPIRRDGQAYALLDFYSTESDYVIRTARQFCIDHGLTDHDLRLIIEHAFAQFGGASVPDQLPPPAQPPPAQPPPAVPPPAGLSPAASKLLEFMKLHRLSAPAVMTSLATLMEQGYTV